MNLLECLVGLALCLALLNPLLKTSADMVAKHIQFDKTQTLITDGDRALTLIGRAIRMAGYSHIQSPSAKSQRSDANQFIQIQKKLGYRGSDFLTVKHGLSDGIDFDCIGNVITKDRTKHQLAHQGFLVEHQAGVPKGAKVNGGSLMCQSLDRQGRIQNTTLMNGIHGLLIEDITPSNGGEHRPQKLYKITLQMTDGRSLKLELQRTFSTRNLL
jgi:hypothetical protein